MRLSARKNSNGFAEWGLTPASWYTSQKFTKATTKKTNVTKLATTLKNLKKGKTYYVKVRAFVKDAAGKSVYSDYSAVQKLKVKK